ncbi:MAG: hypothetical protein IT585_04630 [candidate division Zixibacteria bacterium]|nr:hypothetical protein [candidate division Zixibacteria bacterium]
MRWSDFTGLLIGAVGGTLAILAYSSYPKATLFLGLSYILLFVLRFIIVFSSRQQKDAVQGKIFWRLCRNIDQDVIDSRLGARITLFWRDPFRRDHIVAKYRYGRGLDDPIKEANDSKARYQWNMGDTGLAWSQPGTLFVSFFPKFATREEFETYYINRVAIPTDIVRELSRYMVDVRTIVSYGLEDSAGRFLGVVSIDFKELVTTSTSSQAVTNSEGFQALAQGETIAEFDEIRINDILKSMQTMLEAFAKN